MHVVANVISISITLSFAVTFKCNSDLSRIQDLRSIFRPQYHTRGSTAASWFTLLPRNKKLLGSSPSPGHSVWSLHPVSVGFLRVNWRSCNSDIMKIGFPVWISDLLQLCVGLHFYWRNSMAMQSSQIQQVWCTCSTMQLSKGALMDQSLGSARGKQLCLLCRVEPDHRLLILETSCLCN